jgi:Protein of unknown function (DUF1214)
MTDDVWHDFCAAVEALGDIVARNSDDPVDRAEGYRYLTRLLRGGLEAIVESTGATHPVVSTLPNQVKIGADNPDNLYQTIGVDGRHDYRITGHRNTVHYLGFGAYGGGGSAGASSGERAGYLEDNQLEIAHDGTFQIMCSGRPHRGNWLPLRPDTRQIIIRQSYLDRRRERPADLAVECLGIDEPYPILDDLAALGTQLLGAAGYAAATAATFEGWTRGFMERPNEMHQRPREELTTNWSDPNITFYHGYWNLEPGQALVVSAVPPECDYWNFQLNNWWMESLDYRFLSVTCNKATARLERDGSVRIVIAQRDPGFGNWMDTAGHRHGTMGLRWVRATSDVQPRTELVDLG